MKIAPENWRSVVAAKGTSLSLRLAPSAGNPLAHTVSGCEAKDQSDGSFEHRRLKERRATHGPTKSMGASERKRARADARRWLSKFGPETNRGVPNRAGVN